MNKTISILRKGSLFITFATLTVIGQAQTRQYIYYFNEDMKAVPEEQAVVIGKGGQSDSLFLVQFYTIADNRLFLIEHFKDSTLSVLHGVHVAYHLNRKKAEMSFYRNNMLHGVSVKWDSAGKTTDSALYYENTPAYIVKYGYYANGSKQIIHEFDNKYTTHPNEESLVIDVNGNPVPYTIWHNLMFKGQYTFRKDKVKENRFMILRYSDDVYKKMVAADPKPKESTFFKTGQEFSINAVDINGNKLKSKDLKGTILVINYWL